MGRSVMEIIWKYKTLRLQIKASPHCGWRPPGELARRGSGGLPRSPPTTIADRACARFDNARIARPRWDPFRRAADRAPPRIGPARRDPDARSRPRDPD